MNRARPMAARLKKKPKVDYEPRSAYGRAVKNKSARSGWSYVYFGLQCDRKTTIF